MLKCQWFTPAGCKDIGITTKKGSKKQKSVPRIRYPLDPQDFGFLDPQNMRIRIKEEKHQPKTEKKTPNLNCFKK